MMRAAVMLISKFTWGPGLTGPEWKVGKRGKPRPGPARTPWPSSDYPGKQGAGWPRQHLSHHPPPTPGSTLCWKLRLLDRGPGPRLPAWCEQGEGRGALFEASGPSGGSPGSLNPASRGAMSRAAVSGLRSILARQGAWLQGSGPGARAGASAGPWTRRGQAGRAGVPLAAPALLPGLGMVSRVNRVLGLPGAGPGGEAWARGMATYPSQLAIRGEQAVQGGKGGRSTVRLGCVPVPGVLAWLSPAGGGVWGDVGGCLPAVAGGLGRDAARQSKGVCPRRGWPCARCTERRRLWRRPSRRRPSFWPCFTPSIPPQP